MRLSHKIFLPILFFVFSFTLIFGAGFAYLNGRKNDLDRRIAEGDRLSAVIRELRNSEAQLQYEIVTYPYDQTPINFEGLAEIENEITAAVEKLDGSTDDATIRTLLNRFRASRAGIEVIHRDLLRAMEEGDPETVSREFDRWSAKVRSVNAATDDLRAYSTLVLSRSAARLTDTFDRMFESLLFLGLITIALSLSLLAYFRKNVTKPIEELSRAADRISAKDFGARLDIATGDELGNLSRVFNNMAEKVEEYYGGLESELRKKDEFIGIASHELKTPLTSLKIFIQMLRQLADARNDDEYRTYLAKIDEQSDRLNRLVVNLLDIARIEGGKIEYAMESFDLNETVRSAIDDMRPVANGHKILLEGMLMRPAFGDEQRIGQVILNLLTNAIKYSPGADTVLVTIEEKGGFARVSVRDYGIGIGPEHVGRVFDRFYRVSDSRQATFPGMGVGLYIAKQIIAKHGGDMLVESEHSEGSVFSFTVPLA